MFSFLKSSMPWFVNDYKFAYGGVMGITALTILLAIRDFFVHNAVTGDGLYTFSGDGGPMLGGICFFLSVIAYMRYRQVNAKPGE